MTSLAEVTNQMSRLVDGWQTYIDQQRALFKGSAAYVTDTPAGQPAPGWYPIMDPAGFLDWLPCFERMRADAQGFNVVPDNAVSRTVSATDSGKVFVMSNTGGNTNITRTFPPNLGATFHATYIFNNVTANSTGTARLVAGNGATLNNDQSLRQLRGRWSAASVIAVGASTYVVQGSLVTDA